MNLYNFQSFNEASTYNNEIDNSKWNLKDDAKLFQELIDIAKEKITQYKKKHKRHQKFSNQQILLLKHVQAQWE